MRKQTGLLWILANFTLIAMLMLSACTSMTTAAEDNAAVKQTAAANLQVRPQAQQTSNRKKADYEDDQIRLRLIRRSPRQIAAFYEGRQFPAVAVKKLSSVCFIAAIVSNKTQQRLWLDLNQWQFKTATKNLSRLDRQYWKKTWLNAGVDKSSQATFGWTLLPDQRDLYPGEGVGGNITLPALHEEFTIIARFDRGDNRDLSPLIVKLNHVTCKQDND